MTEEEKKGRETAIDNFGFDLTITDLQAAEICHAMIVLQDRIHRNAVNHGFWDGSPDPARFIALMHSELSEALEALRKGNPASVKIPGNSHLAEELADCMIRILDFAGGMEIDIAKAIVEKHNYNIGRIYKHGKSF